MTNSSMIYFIRMEKEEKIINLLLQNYAISVKDIIPGPRQFVAETYIVTEENNEKYFLKWIKQGRYTENITGSLPVLDQLSTLGISSINYPIKTIRKEFYIQINDNLVVLFNYINAKQTFDFAIAPFAHLLASIHKQSGKITISVIKESFSPSYRNEILPMLDKIFNNSPSKSIEKQMQEFLLPKKAQIHEDWKIFLAICDKCRQSQFDNVLTHGDAPGNTLQDNNGNLFLVDWDDVKLAPAERDTWFMKNRPEFFEAYKTIFPNYQLNQLAYSFYLYNRFWDDLLGFIEEIRSDKSQEHKERNLNQLKHDCYEWLYPLIRETKSDMKF